MARQDDNRKILKILDKLIDEYTDQRFGQLIANYVFPFYREEDIFFQESSNTLKNIELGIENSKMELFNNE